MKFQILVQQNDTYAQRDRNRGCGGLLLEPDLSSLPSTTRALEPPVVPVESPREEKKLINDFQVESPQNRLHSTVRIRFPIFFFWFIGGLSNSRNLNLVDLIFYFLRISRFVQSPPAMHKTKSKLGHYKICNQIRGRKSDLKLPTSRNGEV